MKVKAIIVTLELLLASLAVAQTTAPGPEPQHGMRMERRATPSPGGMDMGMDMGRMMRPPMELLSQWWKNPEIANQLRLTDAQSKQLDQANLNTKLALIDTAADGMKAFTRAGALLDTDQLDEAAYNQQLTALSTDAANIVKNFGQMALTIRRVLTPDQWKKLQALRHEHRPMMPAGRPHPERPMPPAPAPAPPPSE